MFVIHSLTPKIWQASFESPAAEAKLNRYILRESSALREFFSPELRSKILDSMQDLSDKSHKVLLEKRDVETGHETILIEYDEVRLQQQKRADFRKQLKNCFKAILLTVVS
jgi:hypothetical protein